MTEWDTFLRNAVGPVKNTVREFTHTFLARACMLQEEVDYHSAFNKRGRKLPNGEKLNSAEAVRTQKGGISDVIATTQGAAKHQQALATADRQHSAMRALDDATGARLAEGPLATNRFPRQATPKHRC